MHTRWKQRCIYFVILLIVFPIAYFLMPHSLRLPQITVEQLKERGSLRLLVCESGIDCSSWASYPAPSVEVALSDEEMQEILELLPALRARRLPEDAWNPTGHHWQHAVPVWLDLSYPQNRIWFRFVQMDDEYIVMARQPSYSDTQEDDWYELVNCGAFMQTVLQYYPDQDQFFPPLDYFDKPPSDRTYEEVRNSPSYQAAKQEVPS